MTNDAVTEGKYIIVYQANDDANSVMALNTTNAGKFFGNTEIDLTENKIVTDDKTVMWDITLESDDHYSISNGNIFVGFKGNNTKPIYTMTIQSENAVGILYTMRIIKFSKSKMLV